MQRFILIGGAIAAVVIIAVVAFILLTAPTQQHPQQQPPQQQSTQPHGNQTLEALIEAAKKEGGVVVIYGGIDRVAMEPLFKAFEEKYGINVEYVELDTKELVARLYSEIRAGAPTADVAGLTGDISTWIKFLEEGNGMPYKVTYFDKLPPGVVYGDGLAYAVSYSVMVYIFNKKLIPQELWPKSLDDILRLFKEHPEIFKGRAICLSDVANAYLRAVETYVLSKVSPTYNETLKAAREAAKEVNAKIRVGTSTRKHVEQVLSGECVIAEVPNLSYLLPIRANASDLGIVIPTDVAVAVPRLVFITKYAQHPNAAKLFMEFLMSEEGQKYLASQGEIVSTINNPYYEEGSIPYLREHIRNLVVLTPDSPYIKELMDPNVFQAWINSYQSLLGLR